MKLEKKTVYRTKTQMEYDAMMRDAEQQGFVWSFGEKATSCNYWNKYKDKTVVYVERDNELAYGPDEDLPLASKYGYAIKDYKRDDVVEIKPGCFCVEAADFETAQRKMKEHLAKEESEEESYTITINGRDVTVVTPDGKTATAHCHPDDDFDVMTGIEVALEKIKNKDRRLTEQEYGILEFLENMGCDEITITRYGDVEGYCEGEEIVTIYGSCIDECFDWLESFEAYNIEDLMDLGVEY